MLTGHSTLALGGRPAKSDQGDCIYAELFNILQINTSPFCRPTDQAGLRGFLPLREGLAGRLGWAWVIRCWCECLIANYLITAFDSGSWRDTGSYSLHSQHTFSIHLGENKIPTSAKREENPFSPTFENRQPYPSLQGFP